MMKCCNIAVSYIYKEASVLSYYYHNRNYPNIRGTGIS